MWVEQIGDLGNDIIINQFSNDGGIYGVEVSSDATFSFHDDQVLSSYISNDSFIVESHSQSPEIFRVMFGNL